MTLPANVGSGTVTGRLIDSTGAAVEGKVTFTPSASKLLNTSASPSPVTILPKPVVATLSDGAFTATLVATDDLDNNPSGWTYLVSFKLTGANLSSFSISVPEGETVDLTTVAPVGSANGVTITQGPAGEAGEPGVGVPEGGTTGQVLAKASATDYDTAWVDQTGGSGDGTAGADGASAYEVAVADGFEGDETAWLASLVGPQGPKGDTGDQGIQGVPGTDGDDGAQGIQGEPGEQGEPGTPGADGDDGADGASAYEVAVAGGFSGDAAAWLASLVGERGPKGDKGDTGDEGPKGDDGDPATVNLTTIPAGSTISVVYNGTAWPSRPTSRTDVIVQWLDFTGEAGVPAGGIEDLDIVIQDSSA